ncbi:MAG: extracellular solute-binding protein [Nitrososphaeria archaeon]
MGQEPKKVDRRNFLYAGLGAIALVAIGAAAYIAMNPPVVTVTQSTIVPTTSIVTTTMQTTVPTTTIVTTTVPTTTVITTSKPQEKLTVLWGTEFVASEQLAMVNNVRKFEEKTGIKVDITFLTYAEVRTKFLAMLEAKTPPDVANSQSFGLVLPAWRGQLEDLSDLFTSDIKNDMHPVCLETVTMFDSTKKKKSLYAVPVFLNSNYVSYWDDLMKEAGYPNIPDDFDGYWDAFKNAQKKLNKPDLYAIGWPLSEATRDTPDTFEQLLLCHGVKILTENLLLNVDDMKFRDAVKTSLDFLVKLYNQGYIPPGSTTWDSSGNNKALLGRNTLMTSNATLSIPASLYETDRDAYYNKLKTIHWPKGPGGIIPPYYWESRSAVIPKGAKVELAKEFLSFIMKKENYDPWIKGTLGRYLPMYKSTLEDSFYNDPKDPHRTSSAKYLKERPQVAYSSNVSPAAGQWVVEAGWAKMMSRVLIDKWDIDKAVEEAFERIKQINQEYKI